MSWTAFVFTLAGVGYLTAQVFRLVDAIEAPAGRRRR